MNAKTIAKMGEMAAAAAVQCEEHSDVAGRMAEIASIFLAGEIPSADLLQTVQTTASNLQRELLASRQGFQDIQGVALLALEDQRGARALTH